MKTKIYYTVAAFMLLGACIARADNDRNIGTLSYSLPQTVLRVEVQANIEQFHAGPYARYAMKYLGIKTRESDESRAEVSDLKLVSFTEADSDKRYVITPGTGAETVLALTAQGLVSLGGGSDPETRWTFAYDKHGDFSDKGIGSNLTSESATLYRNVKDNSRYNMIAVRQEMVVEKSLEMRAKEAADMIFSLRKKKLQIVSGDTDASYSGEAMGAAIKEIDRMEKEYLEMFIGYSDVQTQKMNFDIVPSGKDGNKGHLRYVAFRISDTEGLVPADNVSGRPYIIEIEPKPVSAPQNQAKAARGNVLYYRIPAICTIRLMDRAVTLLQSRVPVYQLGIISNFTISNK